MAKRITDSSIFKVLVVDSVALLLLMGAVALEAPASAAAPVATTVASMPTWLVGLAFGLTAILLVGVSYLALSWVFAAKNPVRIGQTNDADWFAEVRQRKTNIPMTVSAFQSSYANMQKLLLDAVEQKDPDTLKERVEAFGASAPDDAQLRKEFADYLTKTLFPKALDNKANNCAEYLTQVTAKI